MEHYNSIGVPVFVVRVEEDGRYIYAFFNSEYVAQVGRDATSWIGKTPQEVFPKRTAEVVCDRYDKLVSSGEPVAFDEFIHIDDQRWWRTSLSPQFDQNHRVVGLVGTAVDVTAQRQGEIAAEQQQADFKRISDELASISSSSANALQSPIHQISAIVADLRDGFQDRGNGKLQMLDALDAVSQKAAGLLDDLVRYSGATDTKTPVEEFALKDLCQDIFNMLDPHGVHEMIYDLEYLATRKVTLQIVLRNLIDSTINRAGDTTLIVGVTVTDTGDGMLEFGVTDNLALPISGDAAAGPDNQPADLNGTIRIIQSGGGAWRRVTSSGNAGSTFTFTLPGTVVKKDLYVNDTPEADNTFSELFS